jgi:thiosulfate/3-mercaptopyruvate sulfurtransferase
MRCIPPVPALCIKRFAVNKEKYPLIKGTRQMNRFRSVALFVLLTLPLTIQAAPAGWSPMLEAMQLAQILENHPEVRVVTVTGDFASGHIPGSVNSPYPQWRGPQENPGAVAAIEHYTPLVQKLGISADTPVVLVHQGSNQADMGAATRVYWTLKSLGVNDLAVLNGGFAAWVAAQLPISTSVEPVSASTYVPQWHDTWRVTTAEVEELVKQKSARLIDARQPGFFEGLTSSTGRPGTIRGASNINFENWFDGNRMKSPGELSSILNLHERPDAPLTVSFCNTGHLASINWFVLSEVAGVENTRLYAESMTEWSMEIRPMDNAPGRARIYWDKTKTWFSNLRGS